jgi:hypothetical protein
MLVAQRLWAAHAGFCVAWGARGAAHWAPRKGERAYRSRFWVMLCLSRFPVHSKRHINAEMESQRHPSPSNLISMLLPRCFQGNARSAQSQHIARHAPACALPSSLLVLFLFCFLLILAGRAMCVGWGRSFREIGGWAKEKEKQANYGVRLEYIIIQPNMAVDDNAFPGGTSAGRLRGLAPRRRTPK